MPYNPKERVVKDMSRKEERHNRFMYQKPVTVKKRAHPRQVMTGDEVVATGDAILKAVLKRRKK